MARPLMPPAAFQNPDRLRAANINPVTGLATDYLNHYNEVAMLIGTLADMPDMAEDVLDWRPIGYPTHFARTGFAERGLAIAGWLVAARDVKAQFCTVRAELESRIADVQRRLAATSVPELIADEAPAIFADIARLGGVINGGKAAPMLQQSAAQDLVDSLFA